MVEGYNPALLRLFLGLPAIAADGAGFLALRSGEDAGKERSDDPLALFGSFLTDTRVVQLGLGVPLQNTLFGTGINISQPIVFIGMLIGGSLIFLFSSLLIRAVNRAAFDMIAVVRRQLRIPGIMEGTKTPDYAECVTVSTRAAQRELLPLGVMAVLTPIVVGFLLGAQALGGFLAGIILAGQLMAVFMANAGGAWDNAKKIVETELKQKGTDLHAATVVGDTVGDPFKDTSSVALNPIIKFTTLFGLLAVELAVSLTEEGGAGISHVLAALFLIAALYFVWRSFYRMRIAGGETPEVAPSTQPSPIQP